MKKQKILSTLTISLLFIGLLSVFLIPQAAATQSVLTYWDWSAQDGNTAIARIHPTADGSGYSGVAQIFKVDTAGYLTAIELRMTKQGSPVTNLTCTIQNTASSNTIVGSTVYATAINQISTWASSFVTVTFYFDATYQLQTDTYYSFVVTSAEGSGTLSDSNFVKIQSDQTSAGYTNGNSVHYYSSAWNAQALSDLVFYIYGQDTSAAPTPTPTPTATPSPSTYLYWNGTAWIPYTPTTPAPNIFENGTAAPYIQMLVPVILLAVAALLGWKFAGAWGFFAGLNLGAILCYAILGSSVFPLWGIIALLIIDGLLLFGKVGIRS